MSNLKTDFVDKVAQTCFNLYQKLPKTGKPVEKEWTVLSCVVKYDNNSANIEVVSLGTGSKCIGATLMSSKGDILNDSHAEVFARRGFLIYLYNNIEKALRNQSSIFSYVGKQFILKENIDFIFYSSQMPCGDASIIPKCDIEDQFGDILESNKRKAENDDLDTDTDSKRLKIDEDVHRTGAKCLPNSEQDPKAPGLNYHKLGLVRTKPGRGDKTLSVSCSDKMAKWVHLGIQGRLLHMLGVQIFIKYFVFGAGTPYSEESLNRALLHRNNCDIPLTIVPEFYQTTLIFSSIKSEENIKPAAGSIVWIKLDNPLQEVAVRGKKLGVTKKNAALPSSSLCISKYHLYKRFMNIITKNDDFKQNVFSNEDIVSVPYNIMKRKNSQYEKQWLKVKENFFKLWTVKPNMWNFCINY